MDLIRLGPSPAMHAATTMNAAIPNNEYFTAIVVLGRGAQSREADLHVFAKFFEDRLERRLEPHFLGVRLVVRTMSWISSSDTLSMSV